MDDDIICLSSDNEDSSQSSQKNPLMNGSQRKSPILLGNGGPNADNLQSLISNGHPSSNTAVKPKKEPEEQDIVTLNSDDDSDFEIEYSSQGRGQNSNGGTQTIDSDDDDIQVLEENIKVNHRNTPETKMMTSRMERRKSYQEKQQNQKTEVSLNVPVLNGLTPGVRREPKSNDITVGASGDGNSSSQDAVLIDDDVVMEESVEEMGEEEEDGDDEEEGDGDVNSNCSSGSGSGGDKPKDEDVDYRAKSRNTLNRFLNEFCARRKDKKVLLKKARKRMMDAYEKTINLNMDVHRRLHERIVHDTEIVRSSAEEQWRTFKELLFFIDPVNLTKDQIKTEEEIREEREAQKMELRRKYERELAQRIQRKIKKLEVAEVDWDAEDDYNSSYMLQEKYKAKLVNAYYTLCTLSKCSHFTGRPTQTKITLKKHNASSEYPEIDAEVEKFVNKMGFLHAPDYTDIFETIQKVNQSKSLGLSEGKVNQTAQKLFESIVKIIKKRREKDFKISMLTTLLPTPKTPKDSSAPSTSGSSGSNPPLNDDVDDPEELEKQLQDPADSDPELLAKLEANISLRKSESEVMDRFARINPAEVGEPVGSDSEDLGETDNEDDEDEEDYQYEERQLSKHHQEAELTEDEDEKQETVGFDGSALTAGRRSSCDSIDDKANESGEEKEDDDSSSDGKTTGESEMDTDVDNIIEGKCSGSETQMETTTTTSNAPSSTTTPAAVIVEKPEVDMEMEKVEDDNQSVKVTANTIELTDTADDDDDKVDGEPPAKRMRADENCNEERDVVAKPGTESEEIAVISVPASQLVVESKGDSVD